MVLKLQWLVNSFKAIISFKNEDTKKGKISEDQIMKHLGLNKKVC
jgi:hypothetical protein